MSGGLPNPEPAAAFAIDDAWWPRSPRPGSAFRHSVGARGADPARWLRPRPLDPVVLAWKASVFEAVGEAAFLARPGSDPAGAEALGLVGAATGTAVADRAEHPLLAAARLVAEDLCLLDVRGDSPVLVAGAVTMPSRWVLADKLGRDLVGVHGPVPGYAETLGNPTDQLLQRLAGDRVMARTAWTVTDDPALFQPADRAWVERDRAAVGRLSIRTEYQTVRALPAAGAVLFTIRTAQEPVSALGRRPDRAATLLSVIRTLPPEQLVYRGIAPYQAPLLAALERAARLTRPA
jgi:hypothetical protein